MIHFFSTHKQFKTRSKIFFGVTSAYLKILSLQALAKLLQEEWLLYDISKNMSCFNNKRNNAGLIGAFPINYFYDFNQLLHPLQSQQLTSFFIDLFLFQRKKILTSGTHYTTIMNLSSFKLITLFFPSIKAKQVSCFIWDKHKN